MFVSASRYGFVSRKTVLRIHDILVWIRIRGSMPLTNGSGFGYGSGCGSGSFYFHFQKKSQNSENQGLSHYFCLMIEGSVYIPLTNGSGSGSRRPRTCGSGSGFGSATLPENLKSPDDFCCAVQEWAGWRRRLLAVPPWSEQERTPTHFTRPINSPSYQRIEQIIYS
jgi:hypothetical protein